MPLRVVLMRLATQPGHRVPPKGATHEAMFGDEAAVAELRMCQCRLDTR